MKSAKPGLHSDGANLYLRVSKGTRGNLRKSWIFRYELAGNKPRDMGLGSIDIYSLDEVRELARGYRKLLKEGIDPIERAHHQTKAATEAAAMAPKPTFDKCAADYIKAHKRKSVKWDRTPGNGNLRWRRSPPPSSAQCRWTRSPPRTHLLKVSQPIWYTRTVTASRVRQQIESVLDFAKNDRDGENPARWRGHLDKLLPAKSKLKSVEHHPALPYAEIGAFMEKLRERPRGRESMSKLALEFCILTAAGRAEVLSASVAGSRLRRENVDGSKNKDEGPSRS